ncbi:hypothetical protein SAMN04487910_0200 [Aquimarina amphilecti]|uniref:Uncharacterized protein n=1 Tax=Aquimarina amphilecti TaxID=1038014 RepID=A0A1H7FWE6_AQUAM|nr:hypothetical protein [Aquimarina amphilecti]SEK30231.1 hypothetical protein SAMN04487910_0200 [Aquimarina amphilecti]
MQKKKVNKILIIAVSLIWGVVLYKFAAPYFLTNDIVVTADTLVSPPKLILRKKDTFDLNIPHRDPFLGKIKKQKRAKVVTSLRSAKKNQSSKNMPKNWPRIEYLGFIKSQKSKSKLGLLRIDGILKRVRKGDEVQGIKIKNISQDNISIQLGKDTRDFGKLN